MGQNVATKQNVYYSNSIINGIDTNISQYPQATNGEFICNNNDTGIAGTNWLIIINPSFVFKGVFFIVNDTVGHYRYIHLKRLDNDGDLIVDFTSRKINSASVYTYTSEPDIPTKGFIMSLINPSTNRSLSFLLCEAEVHIGCSQGTWGIHCKNTCNKSCPRLCRFDDGLCSNSCFGYSDPPRCKKACLIGFWGLNCMNTCSNRCLNSSCGSITGLCDKGCIGYDDPKHCITVNLLHPFERSLALEISGYKTPGERVSEAQKCRKSEAPDHFDLI
uniref:Fucolectin tachylectin-4 pentraxin-1 domain-containing protein n=1 Tax=Biomphalaria glabrata TaxID=6526 RepID=A0A2C9KFC9_BIOGL